MKKTLLFPLLASFPLILSACSLTNNNFEIELDEFTPMAYVGEEYDFTDVLYVDEGATYQLEVYYQDYKTMEEHTLPVVDTFYFTPIAPYDITVIVNASKGGKSDKRTRRVPVSSNPEKASRYNLEMCNFEPGEWRGTGSSSEISYTDTYGETSKSSRKVIFKNSWDLPETDEENNPNTVNASLNLATTEGLGTDNGIDAKQCMLSFDVKFSSEFFDSININRNLFIVKIEDDAWIPSSATPNLTDSVDDFKYENTDNGWLHVEQNLYETSELDGLGNGTYVLTLGFFGISNATKENAHIFLDNVALTEIPDEKKGEREIPTQNNIEMCRFEPGAYRGTGSKAEISYTELRGENSTSSRKVTFAGSQGLPNVVDNENFATVNASFNLANTWSIGTDNGIDAKNCTLSFDIRLSREFFESGHQYKHLFLLKIEDEAWVPNFTWISFVNNADDFRYENTDNGWIHFSQNLAWSTELAGLGNSTYVMTFGLFGITNTTRLTSYAVFDNICLTPNN